MAKARRPASERGSIATIPNRVCSRLWTDDPRRGLGRAWRSCPGRHLRRRLTPASIPPFSAGFRLSEHGELGHPSTVRAADRAVLIELRRFLAVIRAASTLPQEHAAAVPAAPPHGSRGAGQGGHEPRRNGAVLHAEGRSPGRCAECASPAGCAEDSAVRARKLAAGPIGPSWCPIDGRTPRAFPTGPRSTVIQRSPGRSKPLPGKPWRILWNPDPEKSGSQDRAIASGRKP